jgi:predicted nucleic acid-binding protein
LTLIDTNVLLDVLTSDSAWADWSLSRLKAVGVGGTLLINDVIYAELSSRFDSMEPLNEFVSATKLELEPMPRAALFLAAKAFRIYKGRGGRREGVLSDFFIGAQASVLDIPILTRDTRRYRSYFPSVRLISPNLA